MGVRLWEPPGMYPGEHPFFWPLSLRAVSVSELSAPLQLIDPVEGYCPHFGCGQSVAPRTGWRRPSSIKLNPLFIETLRWHLEDLMELYGDEKSLEENHCLMKITIVAIEIKACILKVFFLRDQQLISILPNNLDSLCRKSKPYYPIKTDHLPIARSSTPLIESQD
ncbi:hypothetical protein CDAR_400961 [Caerostris darwini]|uniref:Uncharacterized protein n=1 Tax=Caerostris darwini TaxID=1538125 RepID=A0AAV4TJB0_9ARAC|nr:hypothetical protein CDAR_400961 [Caerostris darwini]